MASMADVLGLIFANMHDSKVNDLTQVRTMASIPFGGRYRLIDFTLSNMVNSGITEVGVITKSNYQSLMDHIGMGREWDLLRKNGGLHLLPPYGHVGSGIYRGRLEALAGVNNFIHHSDAEYVVLSDSDIISNMNLKDVVDFHEKQKADITAVYGRTYCSVEKSKTKTVLLVNDNHQVYDVLLRPQISGELNTCLNIYVMKKKFLENLINESSSRNLYSFEVDVLQHKFRDYKICGYHYKDLFMQIDGMDSFFDSNMKLMCHETRDALFKTTSPIYTKVRDEAPSKYGIDADVANSVVADGCLIEGSVKNSVIFRGVKIGKGAVISNSVVMQGSVIEAGADINHCILDKNVKISPEKTLTGTESYPVYIKKGSTI